jgi:hypothetical protein
MSFIRVTGVDAFDRLKNAAEYVSTVAGILQYMPQLQSQLTHIDVRYVHSPKGAPESAAVVHAPDNSKFGIITINTAKVAILEVNFDPDNYSETGHRYTRQLTIEELIGHGIGHIIEANGQPITVNDALRSDETKAVETERLVGDSLGLITSRGHRPLVSADNPSESEWSSRIYAQDTGKIINGKPVELINQFELQKGIQYRDARCFPAGTLIAMADGSRKPIELIRAGDRVLGFAGQDPFGRLVAGRVSKLIRNVTERWMSLAFLDGERLVATPGHEMLGPDGSFARLDRLVTWETEERGRVTLVGADGKLRAAANDDGRTCVCRSAA